MTKITSPSEGFTGKTSFGPLDVEFVEGQATVEELPDAVRSYLLGAGYTVEAEDATPKGTPDETWKVAELTEWAKAHDVDLGDATRKADILALLVEESTEL